MLLHSQPNAPATPITDRKPLVLLAARVPRSLRQRVRLICAEQDRQMQDFIVEAIREWLEAQRHRRH